MDLNLSVRKSLGIPPDSIVYMTPVDLRNQSFKWKVLREIESFDYSTEFLGNESIWLILSGDQICEIYQGDLCNIYQSNVKIIAVVSHQCLANVSDQISAARKLRVDGIVCDMWLDEINRFNTRKDIKFFGENSLLLENIDTHFESKFSYRKERKIHIVGTHDQNESLSNSIKMIRFRRCLPDGYFLVYIDFENLDLFGGNQIDLAESDLLISFIEDNDFNDYLYEKSIVHQCVFKRYRLDSNITSLFRKSCIKEEKFTLRGLVKLVAMGDKQCEPLGNECSFDLRSIYERVFSEWNGYFHMQTPMLVSENPMAMKVLTALAKEPSPDVRRFVLKNLFDSNQSYLNFPGDVGVVWGHIISTREMEEPFSEALFSWIETSKPSASWIEILLEFTSNNLYNNDDRVEERWKASCDEVFDDQHGYLLAWIRTLVKKFPEFTDAVLFVRFRLLFFSGKRGEAFEVLADNVDYFSQSKIYQSLLYIYCYGIEREWVKEAYKKIGFDRGRKSVATLFSSMLLSIVFDKTFSNSEFSFDSYASLPFNEAEILPLYLLCELLGVQDQKERILQSLSDSESWLLKFEKGFDHKEAMQFPDSFVERFSLFVSKRLEMEKRCFR